ncbi:MAG: MBL fold metallo-hydrolase [Spirochaetaceae bacterium]|jgi:glyoxylase-like metal-dependent hydrolase (beta-lactamase superfamily II)|nr:MBL fold metallo-hydrolase [Spirochaetaceae bacterium]
MQTLIVGLLDTNCYIYPLESCTESGLQNAAVIDPGGDEGIIIDALHKGGWFPQWILLTHGHFDHILALSALCAEYKGVPRVAISAEDRKYIGGTAYDTHYKVFSRIGCLPYIGGIKASPPPEPDIILDEGTEAGPFTTLLLPGHSAGSAGFYDKKAGVLFSGDTLFCGGYGRADLIDSDETALTESLKRLLAMDEKIRVYSGHGPVTTIGTERARYSL